MHYKVISSTVSALYTFISHPNTILIENIKKTTVLAKFLQRCRQKHLPLRKQEVTTQCPLQIQIPKQNKVFPKHNMGQSEA